MIELSNGHRFEYMAASGALAFDGRGWPWEWPLRWLGLLDPTCFTVVTKTLTRAPRRGNLRWSHPWGVVRCVAGGTVNAIGLTNPGIDWWLRHVGPRVAGFRHQLVVSIHADAAAPCAEMARRLDSLPIVGIELNASCPNIGEDPRDNTQAIIATVQAVRAVTRHPLILKLGVTNDSLAIVKAVRPAIAAVAINSVPWHVAFPGQLSPLGHWGGGGVSGRAAQSHNWQLVQDLVEHTSIPVIGPSVWHYDDIARLRRLGAKAVSFGALFLRYPWRPTAYVRRDRREHQLRG